MAERPSERDQFVTLDSFSLYPESPDCLARMEFTHETEIRSKTNLEVQMRWDQLLDIYEQIGSELERRKNKRPDVVS